MFVNRRQERKRQDVEVVPSQEAVYILLTKVFCCCCFLFPLVQSNLIHDQIMIVRSLFNLLIVTQFYLSFKDLTMICTTGVWIIIITILKENIVSYVSMTTGQTILSTLLFHASSLYIPILNNSLLGVTTCYVTTEPFIGVTSGSFDLVEHCAPIYLLLSSCEKK